MSDDDRRRWDERYAAMPSSSEGDDPPILFAPFADLFPTSGYALDLACGAGADAVWLARRGLHVLGVDISSVAIAQARALAGATGMQSRCEFLEFDLDGGLPPGPQANLVLCNNFRDERLDAAIVRRLAPGGVLAISALSEVGARPGRFRVGAGELQRAFADLTVLAAGEGDGRAWLTARR